METTSKKDIAIDAGMVLSLVLFPHFLPLPFYSYAIVCFAAMLVILKRRGKNLRDIGLKKAGVTFKTIVIGLVSALLWVAFMRWVFVPALSYMFTLPDYTEYDFIRNNISNLVITVIAAWIVGGFYEELVFRGFIQTTFEKYLHPFWPSALLTSLLFGVYHWQQGIFGIVAAFLGGLYWSFIYWRFGRNLWTSIFSHALFDTITLLLIYLGLFGK